MVYLFDAFLGGFFLKTESEADPEISRREKGELLWFDMVHFMILLAKRGR